MLTQPTDYKPAISTKPRIFLKDEQNYALTMFTITGDLDDKFTL